MPLRKRNPWLRCLLPDQVLGAAGVDGAFVLPLADLLVLRQAGLLHFRVRNRPFATERHGADAALARLAAGGARAELLVGDALKHLEHALALVARRVERLIFVDRHGAILTCPVLTAG